jgi:hypothetical protein
VAWADDDERWLGLVCSALCRFGIAQVGLSLRYVNAVIEATIIASLPSRSPPKSSCAGVGRVGIEAFGMRDNWNDDGGRSAVLHFSRLRH